MLPFNFFNVLNFENGGLTVVFLWENFYIFRYLKRDYVVYNGTPLN